ncbi:MAG: IS1380 family transposase [Bifidobacteriaceae bacterium]|nr:IS1380 family transposase [Bifidobacteriaceae bacterium]
MARVHDARFDDANLLPAAGVLPVMSLAREAGLAGLAERHVKVPTDKGARPGAKVMAVVAGMAMGADSIDDLDVVRAGAMSEVAGFAYAPSTLGQFLRKFKFGHVRQLDAVAARLVPRLAEASGLLGQAGGSGRVMADIDDSVVEVHGYRKQGAGRGYSGVKGLNMFLATVAGDGFRPAVIGARLRKGSVSSPRGAARLIQDALKTVSRTHLAGRPVLMRADSAFFGRPAISAALKAGADVSVTAKMAKPVKRAIAAIPDDAWVKIKYTNAVWDADQQRWISDAEVAEVPFTAFEAQRKANHIEGRLVVRRVKELNPKAKEGQDELFQLWRHHPVFTTLDAAEATAVRVDEIHRDHAVIEQVNSDLKASAMAHMPSGVFTANAAWLVLATIAHNLLRAAATLTGDPKLGKATTPTIRRELVHVPGRLARSGRRFSLHLPRGWPWREAWTEMSARIAALRPAPALLA